MKNTSYAFPPKVIVILIILSTYSITGMIAQCYNTIQWPQQTISAPIFSGQVVTVTTQQHPGDYCVIGGMIIGKTYVFSTSAIPVDYITRRIQDGTADDPPLSHGPSFHIFTATTDIEQFHINLSSPMCGRSNVPRTSVIECLDCDPVPPNVGVNTTDPLASLDINGRVRIGDDPNPPQPGMIRWNPSLQDFEGYNGTQWISFTRSNSSWGNQPNTDAIEDLAISASDGAANDWFGYSVDIDGDYAIIGAYLDNVGSNSDQGSAYIFHRTGNSWTQQAKLTADDGAASDWFGYSVDIKGDYAIIGSPYDDVGSTNDLGSAYIFHRSGTAWLQQDHLTIFGGSEDLFGWSVGITEDYAIVSAAFETVGTNVDGGAAYIFNRSGATWSQQAKLIPSDGDLFDYFGW